MLEESINKIKFITRIVYGYRDFQNYKYRILLIFKNKIKETFGSASFFGSIISTVGNFRYQQFLVHKNMCYPLE
ncbi:hypothetical protein DW196_09065 [Vagococcus sp. AM17-17]|nr:hypothetical protein DW196_09065 [Vagococcus sp. AM17-17]